MFDQPVNWVNREQNFFFESPISFSPYFKTTSFSECNKPKGWWARCCKYFFEFGCKSTKKCAKSTILNMKVRIRKFKCHQKIPWVRFAGNDISNYGLILNRNGARDQKIILMKKFIFFLESAHFWWISFFQYMLSILCSYL